MADSFAKFLEYEARNAHVRRLDFSFKKLPLLELTHLANSHLMAQVETWSLCGVGIDDEGLAALSSGVYFAELRSLNLGSNRIGDLGIEALVTSPNFPVLEDLNLRRNDLRLPGAQLLCNPSAMQSLKRLNVDYNENLTIVGCEILSRRFNL